VERVLAASAVITDGEGRVLLVLRGSEPEKGCWSVPGGRAEDGETLQQTAAREAYEETGLVVTIGRELWSVQIPTGHGRLFEVHDFAATVVGGTLTPGDDAADARWFTADQLDDVPLTHDLRGYLARAGVIAAVRGESGDVSAQPVSVLR
jgi:acetyl-CoA carboxylase carboxyl transferase subunit beta